MLTFTLSFLIGVAQLLWLPELRLFWLIPISLITIISFYFFIKLKVHHSLIIFGAGLGLIYAVSFGIYAKSHQLNILPEGYIKVIGKVSNLPVYKNEKTKFSFEINEIDNNYKLKKVLVSWYKADKIVESGQIWEFDLKLKPIHGYKNPGSFDYSKWLFRQGYDATATVKKAKLIQAESFDPRSIINIIRSRFSNLIEAEFTSTRIQALIKALSIGDKSQISYEDSQLFQETGTAHLIAISGLHIGLVAYIGLLFGRLIFLFYTNEKLNRFKYEAFFSILFALIYALLAGFSIPTIRAFIMVMSFSLAYAIKAYISRWQAWSIAMLVVLLIDPFSVLDVGFWFSFTAVAVLMFAFTGRKSNYNKILSFIHAQFVILIGLMPMMVIVFGSINLLTPIANLIVLPLASLLLIPLLLVSFIVYLFSESVAKFLFNLVEEIAQYLFLILDFLQPYKFLSVAVNQLTFLIVTSLITISILLLLPKLFRWKYMAIMLFIPIFYNNPKPLNQKEYRINILDVGQGLSIIISTKDHTMIYDTGAKYETGFNLASSVVIPFLQYKGIDNVDKLIISHSDNDHAGGKEELIEQFSNIQIYDVVAEKTPCIKGEEWQWNEVDFEVISPYNLKPYLGNNSSCVIKISSQYGSILLTGDIEEPIEYRLVHQMPQAIKSQILLVPHHGSRTSSGEEFIKAVNPEIALNSSGYANQFNHPHPLIKKLYLEKGIEFFDTQDKGMLEVLFNKEGYELKQYSDVNHHFWQVK
jgi:competence protein ComEC